MSNLNTEDIAVLTGKPVDGDVKFTSDGFKEFNGEHGWLPVPAVDVPVDILLLSYEDFVFELSSKEVEYFTRKESYNALGEKIIQETVFKALYGKNNEKVRKEHVKKELANQFQELKDLEFSIDWIQRYISFLREVIRTKRTIMERD